MSEPVRHLHGTRLRLVLDTNVVVSGLLWGGHSRRLLELALGTTAPALVAHYSAMVMLATPQEVARVIAQDADDDHVLACALQARAHLIASGDQHLHSLGGSYQGVRIVTPAEAVGLLQAL
ncbi:MAG: PIN domain-containing protein [Rhodoferax sp.]